MANSVRCKFECYEITKRKHWTRPVDWLYSYKFQAVTGASPENKAFFDATPSGSIEVSAVKEDLFEPGKQYFIDISEA